MTKNNSTNKLDQTNECFLPDFCNSETILRLILVLELMAMVLALSSAEESSGLFIHLALISMLIQWIGLTSAALLCLLGRIKVLNKTLNATIISLLVVTSVTAIMSILAYLLNEGLKLDMFQYQSMLLTIVYHEAISLILYGLALRYFFIQFTSKKIIKAESKSRLQALQARIRPHFCLTA